MKTRTFGKSLETIKNPIIKRALELRGRDFMFFYREYRENIEKGIPEYKEDVSKWGKDYKYKEHSDNYSDHIDRYRDGIFSYGEHSDSAAKTGNYIDDRHDPFFDPD